MEETIIMTNKEAKRYEIITHLINKKINGTQASRQIGVSTRQIRRLKANVKKYGIKRIVHKQRGKESNRKLSKKTREEIITHINEHYADFTSQLTYEKLTEVHHIKTSYSTIRRIRIDEGLSTIKSRKTNKQHYTQRERKEYYGELIQFDGSYDDWFEKRCTDKEVQEEQCLLLAVDDATGEPTPVLDKNEGIVPVFKFWKEYILEKGKPIAIYIDKFSTYKINHKNAVDNKEFTTQFQRAMKELDIRVIFAHSPQAKGRVERMNSTFQDRLVKELRLQNIHNTKDANRFIQKEFTPNFIEKLNVRPKKKGDMHRKLTKQEKKKLHHIFSIKEQRTVRNDFVIQYKNRYFQLHQIQPTAVYKKDSVTIEECLDGSISICKKTSYRDIYLHFKELDQKPKKEIHIKLPAITLTKSHYTPPAEHPWRKFQFSKRQEEIEV